MTHASVVVIEWDGSSRTVMLDAFHQSAGNDRYLYKPPLAIDHDAASPDTMEEVLYDQSTRKENIHKDTHSVISDGGFVNVDGATTVNMELPRADEVNDTPFQSHSDNFQNNNDDYYSGTLDPLVMASKYSYDPHLHGRKHHKHHDSLKTNLHLTASHNHTFKFLKPQNATSDSFHKAKHEMLEKSSIKPPEDGYSIGSVARYSCRSDYKAVSLDWTRDGEHSNTNVQTNVNTELQCWSGTWHGSIFKCGKWCENN